MIACFMNVQNLSTIVANQLLLNNLKAPLKYTGLSKTVMHKKQLTMETTEVIIEFFIWVFHFLSYSYGSFRLCWKTFACELQMDHLMLTCARHLAGTISSTG